MKTIKQLLPMLCLCVFSYAQAQWQPTGNLTVFSESGKKFYLILNGEKYNDEAETNVRIEELPNPYYNCKIIFEDNSIAPISKNALMVADFNNVMQDVTYRIKADKKGKYSLSFYSYIPAQQNMMRPANTAVYRYGTPHQPLVGSNGVVYTQPVITQAVPVTTVVTQPVQTVVVTQPAPTMSVNVPGVSVNVNVPTVTTTTTVVNTPSYQNPQPRRNEYRDRDYNNRGGGCRTAMNPADFEAARRTVANNGFDETRLSTAQQIVSSNCLSTDQVIVLLNGFSFEQTKLDFAKYAYNFCVDRGNYFKVANSFSFESSKIDLNNYMQSYR